eukprot:TRINITY_DN16545_c0_g1_i1.p1 TRINITY_DN16545_c0_g1~~TRINITY_DN16545_c0_g1_i1.p1  ORF type:complete len:754 (+),score=177.97 TRINITY_DN16545_c0_g1_i1:61-2322(+)
MPMIELAGAAFVAGVAARLRDRVDCRAVGCTSLAVAQQLPLPAPIRAVGSVTCVHAVPHPDGTVLAAAADGSTVHVFEERSGRVIAVVDGRSWGAAPEEAVVVVRLSQRATVVALGTTAGRVVVCGLHSSSPTPWQSRTRDVVVQHTMHAGSVVGIAWGPDGVYSLGSGGQLFVYDWLKCLPPQLRFDCRERAVDMQLSQSGRLVALATCRRCLVLRLGDFAVATVGPRTDRGPVGVCFLSNDALAARYRNGRIITTAPLNSCDFAAEVVSAFTVPDLPGGPTESSPCAFGGFGHCGDAVCVSQGRVTLVSMAAGSGVRVWQFPDMAAASVTSAGVYVLTADGGDRTAAYRIHCSPMDVDSNSDWWLAPTSGALAAASASLAVLAAAAREPQRGRSRSAPRRSDIPSVPSSRRRSRSVRRSSSVPAPRQPAEQEQWQHWDLACGRMQQALADTLELQLEASRVHVRRRTGSVAAVAAAASTAVVAMRMSVLWVVVKAVRAAAVAGALAATGVESLCVSARADTESVCRAAVVTAVDAAVAASVLRTAVSAAVAAGSLVCIAIPPPAALRAPCRSEASAAQSRTFAALCAAADLVSEYGDRLQGHEGAIVQRVQPVVEGQEEDLRALLAELGDVSGCAEAWQYQRFSLLGGWSDDLGPGDPAQWSAGSGAPALANPLTHPDTLPAPALQWTSGWHQGRWDQVSRTLRRRLWRREWTAPERHGRLERLFREQRQELRAVTRAVAAGVIGRAQEVK